MFIITENDWEIHEIIRICKTRALAEKWLLYLKATTTTTYDSSELKIEEYVVTETEPPFPWNKKR